MSETLKSTMRKAAVVAMVALGLMTGNASAATLYIAEFASGVSQVGSSISPLLGEPDIADQSVTFTTTTQSAAFNKATHAVMLLCDSACSIAFGASPTATTANFKLPANVVVSFVVVPGQKVAAITNP